MLIIDRAQIAQLMRPDDYLTAVEAAFAWFKSDSALSPPPMHVPGVGGGFHAKGATLLNGRKGTAIKINGNFPGNVAHGLPTIQGVLVLCDAENGAVLALMDSAEITLWRTAAASALAARYLARSDAETLALIGCGEQGRAHAAMLTPLFKFKRALVWDVDRAKAQAFARRSSAELAMPFDVADTMRTATQAADVIVTCTTSRAPFLDRGDVGPGVFIAALGADNPEKSELTPALMAAAKVVVDVIEQCAAMGDLRHAIAAGAMKTADVHCDLGDLVLGRATARTRTEEICIFDSTGTAIQDVASAALIFERATAQTIGRQISLT